MKVDWQKTLAPWEPSSEAQPVSDENELKAIVCALKWVGENRFEKIKFFEAALLSKGALEKDQLDKNELLIEASLQVAEHLKVWTVHLDREKKFGQKTYEIPFASHNPKIVRYFKLQFLNKKNELYTPSKIEEIYIRYHEANSNIEIVYET